MRPKQQQKARHDDLFRARLDQIINMKHELVVLADKIDWAWLDEQLADYFSDEGRPAEPVRFMIGMFILKHTYGLADEEVWDRWVFDPYFQYFTGEEFFQHDLPHERSGMSHWRKRIGGHLDILLAESLRIAHDTGALKKSDLARVTIDTTVQPKNVAFPTDAKLLETAIHQLGKLARRNTAWRCSQSYIARRQEGGDDGRALRPRQTVQAHEQADQIPAHPSRPAHSRYSSARSTVMMVLQDDLRHAANQGQADPRPEAAPTRLEALFLARSRDRVHRQGKGPGKALRVRRQGLAHHHQQALQGRPVHPPHQGACPAIPYDGHTLKGQRAQGDTRTSPGREIERAYVDKGYQGHDAPKAFRVYQAPARSAACTARSRRSSDGDRPSRPSSDTARPTAISAAISSKATSATKSTPS